MSRAAGGVVALAVLEAARCNRPDRPACDLISPTPTIPDQRQKEEIAKKIISRFTRLAALACAIAGLVQLYQPLTNS